MFFCFVSILLKELAYCKAGGCLVDKKYTAEQSHAVLGKAVENEPRPCIARRRLILKFPVDRQRVPLRKGPQKGMAQGLSVSHSVSRYMEA